jgi:hypothetical protein
MRVPVVTAAVCLATVASPSAFAAPKQPLPDGARIEELTKAGVFRVSAPRADLDVSAAGVHVTPPMGLTSWAAFKRVGAHTVVMGDTVMTEDQVNPVMTVALDAGLEVTALHNHFFWDSPKVMFMHIGGMGDEAKLARAVGAVFAKIAETSGNKGDTPRAAVDPAGSTLDVESLDAAFAGRGAPGEYKDGVYKIVVGRSAKMSGHAMGKAMGVNTWAALAGSPEHAVIDGDFAMVESELQPVLKALRARGIDVVAIHQHMSGEQPRVLFLHYWGVGRATDLAAAVVAALKVTKHDGAP